MKAAKMAELMVALKESAMVVKKAVLKVEVMAKLMV
jgi:hypothetical protein